MLAASHAKPVTHSMGHIPIFPIFVGFAIIMHYELILKDG